MIIRPAQEADLPALAALWHRMWHVAHAAHLPDALVSVRTLDRFAARLAALRAQTSVAGPLGAPIGFCTIAAPELDQLFVSPDAQGMGVAAALMVDAETRLRKAQVQTAFLYCLPENSRAIAFYERQGWTLSGIEAVDLPDANGLPLVRVARLEKTLLPPKMAG